MGKRRKKPATAAAVVLRADIPDRDGKVHTAGELFDIACRTPGAVYDPRTKTLTMRIKETT